MTGGFANSLKETESTLFWISSVRSTAMLLNRQVVLPTLSNADLGHGWQDPCSPALASVCRLFPAAARSWISTAFCPTSGHEPILHALMIHDVNQHIRTRKPQSQRSDIFDFSHALILVMEDPEPAAITCDLQ